MSLTAVIRTFVVLLLFSVCALAGWRYGPSLGSYLSEAQSTIARGGTIEKRSIVYRLREGRTLTFAFSQPVDLVRLLSVTVVNPEATAKEGGFVYGLRARLYDSRSELLDEQEFFLHSRAPASLFPVSGRTRFYRNRPETVAEQDEVFLASPSPAVRIEIELLEKDDDIRAIDLRVYERRPTPGSQGTAVFLRRTDEEQRSLAEANAFPVDMLTPEEVNSIGANMWRPLGPNGIAGRDYEALVLYEASHGTDPGAGE